MRTRLLLVWLLAAPGVACHQHVPLARFGPEGRLQGAPELLRRAAEASQVPQTLQAEGKLRLHSQAAKGVLSVSLWAQRPSSLRLEGTDFLNRLQVVLVVGGGQFGLFQAQENRYYRGPASAANISQFLPLPFTPEEWVLLFLGQVPLTPQTPPALGFDQESQAYTLSWKLGAATQTVWIHPTHYRVLKSSVRGGSRPYEVTFEDFTEVKAQPFPKRLVLTTPTQSTTVELRYKSLSLDAPLDGTLFQPVAPKGAQVEDVDAQGGRLGR